MQAFCCVFTQFLSSQELIEKFIELFKARLEETSEEEMDFIREKADLFIFYYLEINKLEMIDKQSLSKLINFLTENLPESQNKHKIQWTEHKKVLETTNNKIESIIETGFSSNQKFHTITQENNQIDGFIQDGLLQLSVEDIGNNLSIYEQYLFSKISATQLTHSSDAKLAPDISIFANHFNHIVLWLTSEILAANDSVKQTNILKKIIELGQYLFDIHNYNGVMEVLCALNKAVVQKLKKAWGGIPCSLNQKLTILEKTMSPLRNFGTYRTIIMQNVNINPIVPYVAAHLKDLTFANDGNKYILSNGLINFEKILLVGNLINHVIDFQKKKYLFTLDENILRYLCNTWHLSEIDLQNCLNFHEPKHCNSIKDNSSSLQILKFNFDNDQLHKLVKSSYGNLSLEALETLYNISSQCYLSSCGVQSINRIWCGRALYNCFSGIELFSILTKYCIEEPKKAKEIAQKLLKEGFIYSFDHDKINIHDFNARHDHFYCFLTEDNPRLNKEEITNASNITNSTEREDQFIYLAMKNSLGGVKLDHYWNDMTCYSCCTGKIIYNWCHTTLQFDDHQNIIDVLNRLLYDKKLIPVFNPNGLHVSSCDEFQNSDEFFYTFSSNSVKRIQKIGALSSVISPRLFRTSPICSNPPPDNFRKKISISISNKKNKVEQMLSSAEVDIIASMMDSKCGIPIEALVQIKQTTTSVFQGIYFYSSFF